MKKLARDFYNRNTLLVAKELLGKKLTHVVNGIELSGLITEVEAYMGINDKASHAYGNRRTSRTEIMYKKPGYAYIYLIYGMYNCLNVVTEEEGIPCAVLIRGIKPISNVDQMSIYRYGKRFKDLTKYQIKNFTNGPGKLCMALKLDRTHNGLDLLGDELFISEGETILEKNIKKGKRINIDYAQEAKDYLWRFYIE